MSTPTTSWPASQNATASGSPTYPKPTTPTFMDSGYAAGRGMYPAFRLALAGGVRQREERGMGAGVDEPARVPVAPGVPRSPMRSEARLLAGDPPCLCAGDPPRPPRGAGARHAVRGGDAGARDGPVPVR